MKRQRLVQLVVGAKVRHLCINSTLLKNGVLVRVFKYNTPKCVKQNCGLDEKHWYGMILFAKLKRISVSK